MDRKNTNKLLSGFLVAALEYDDFRKANANTFVTRRCYRCSQYVEI